MGRARRAPACLSSPLPEPLGLLPPPVELPRRPPCTPPGGGGWGPILHHMPSPWAGLARPAPHTGAISYLYFGSGVGAGGGRQGQMGHLFILVCPSPQPDYPGESVGGSPALSRKCQHRSIPPGLEAPPEPREVPRVLPALPSPQAGVTAPHLPVPFCNCSGPTEKGLSSNNNIL